MSTSAEVASIANRIRDFRGENVTVAAVERQFTIPSPATSIDRVHHAERSMTGWESESPRRAELVPAKKHSEPPEREDI